ncbi:MULTISPECIES: DUF924 family protein [Reinekea]|jgi:uncharacterized protein (DUF924 family)|uniref:Transmembrane protein n=1 Tax=Reinekea forsetii TaxID=1336806 RepID=A0A2K8KSF0_9GAMM|nr:MULTISPECIES: DUF924 family protein [Reinekea]ATX77633.1 hypothetical protein REIFOR_02508 [Reinekea forsetii]MDO7642409.1 DUF924 domain-containing protein [Reinekea forsetii]MDO7645947.1 DUF924 domain-containing protein [Reinekea forsetii]|tara:strand:+ start:196 stop:735 length:540 start_codon:yes stop_codon:yes gene_type:complete
MTYDDVLFFWFNDIKPAQWWVKDLDFDRLIERRFSALHEQAIRCELFAWRASAKGRLAEIIVLDQFSRNMFRDTPKAFGSDPLALALAQEAVALGVHNDLTEMERSFMIMPFMHSESLIVHDAALTLFIANGIPESLNSARRHRAIIEQFGRYPHRNLILGRASTPEELEFLTQPGSSF